MDMDDVEGTDMTIEDYLSDSYAQQSDIARFYAGKAVFITGSTGFMGTILMEKILRSCPNVEKVYVMMRAKKGKCLEERFKEQFDGPAFEPLRLRRPGFQLKVYPLEGDCSQPMLGLSQESLDKLKEVNVVFHMAATVRFDEKMRLATAINVRSTIDLLAIARTMPELKAFVHVSTAYTYPQNKTIEEKFYTPDVTPDRLISIVDSMEDDMLNAITPQLITTWPNTYAFTKAVGEDAVRQYGKGLPITVVRPSIVISTAKEPISGWINNVYGPTGVVAGAGVGLMRVLNCNSDKRADMVPVDMAINSVIAAAWDVGSGNDENRQLERGEEAESEPAVLNYVSCVDQPITWGEFMKFSARGIEIPSMRCVWYYDFRLISNVRLYLVLQFLMHSIPGFLVDLGCRATGRKPFLQDAYRKIHKFSTVIAYFSTQDWNFRNDNVHKLLGKMNAMDRKVFDFNLKKLNWDQYLRVYMRGLRAYLLGDPLDTLEESKVRYFKLKMVHYTIVWALRLLGIWLLLKLLRWTVL